MTPSISALARTLTLTALLSAGHGARTRRSSTAAAGAKSRTVAGVPVRNYRAGADGMILLFERGAGDKAIESVCKGRCDLVGHPDAGGMAFAKVRGSLEEVEQMLLENKEGVELVESDNLDHAIPEIEEESDEVRVASLASWGLDSVGVYDRPSTGKGVHIYVQDTGIRVTHQDFGGRAIPTLDLTSGSLVECGGKASCAGDVAGHGTHCAGTAGGSTYGVSSESTIHAVKTLADSGTGQRSWNIAAIDWTAAQGERPAVISLSLGGSGQDSAYKAAIDAAAAAGITVVVAAGNFGSDSCTFSPAFVPSAITVGATDSGNQRAAYSNFGTCNDIMAPGSSVTSASQAGDTRSARLTGTSMACPHVSGAAALLLEQNPSWKRDQIMSRLENYGAKGLVTGLQTGDPDLFLWVGKDAAPSFGCPAFAKNEDPNYWGDCECPTGQSCSRDGGASKNCPSAWGLGGQGGLYFEYTCTDCKCY